MSKLLAVNLADAHMVYLAAVDEADSMSLAERRFYGLAQKLRQPKILSMTHTEVERIVQDEGREILRELFQQYLKDHGHGDVGSFVDGADGIRRTHKRLRDRVLTSVFGEVINTRLGYGGREESSLFPKDAQLNLANDRYSLELRRKVATEAAKGSFAGVCESISEATGVQIPKRQVELLTQRASADFDAFYYASCAPDLLEEARKLPLLILSCDGKGIVMRTEDLRAETRERAASATHKLKKRLSKGEKTNRKRMATVASVYNIARHRRTAEDIVSDLSPIRAVSRKKKPGPAAKRTWASIEKDHRRVISDMFAEAFRRDLDYCKQWIALVDGDRKQIKQIRLLAKRHNVVITVILDIIHVIEYLWKAARVFYEETSKECEEWVQARLLKILQGQSSTVAAAMRRSATMLKIAKPVRAPVDKCAGYLISNAPYLRYDVYLKGGYPIATGVIEGACRHLIKDRMDITGARWSLAGAEAVLKLRSLRASEDFEVYWKFHESQEFARNHEAHYLDIEQIKRKPVKIVKKS